METPKILFKKFPFKSKSPCIGDMCYLSLDYPKFIPKTLIQRLIQNLFKDFNPKTISLTCD